MCEANATELTVMLDLAVELLSQARSSLVEAQSVAELVEGGHAARVRYDNFSRHKSSRRPSGPRAGAKSWPPKAARAGVIRSALPVRGSRG